METTAALRLADERKTDLIEISPDAKPPVCRLMDFGKFKYNREKGEREHGKKQKEVGLKGIRIGFKTGTHDLEMRARQIEKFLAAGDKVRIQMKLAGREKAHGALAQKKFEEFLRMITVEITLESPPRRTPQGVIAVITKK